MNFNLEHRSYLVGLYQGMGRSTRDTLHSSSDSTENTQHRVQQDAITWRERNRIISRTST